MRKIFDIDYKRLIVLLLPTFLRKPILFSFLKALIQPLIKIYDSFLLNRTQNLYKIDTTGQVCYLRKMLNDNFDSEQRRIYIGEGLASDWIFVYLKSLFNTSGGKQPTCVGNADSLSTTIGKKTYVFNSENTGVTLISKQGTVGASGLDFTVMVPSELRGIVDESRLTSLINYYKLASKRYAITYY
jgi:hypothetical protein